jgi:hypothetical protein
MAILSLSDAIDSLGSTGREKFYQDIHCATVDLLQELLLFVDSAKTWEESDDSFCSPSVLFSSIDMKARCSYTRLIEAYDLKKQLGIRGYFPGLSECPLNSLGLALGYVHEQGSEGLDFPFVSVFEVLGLEGERYFAHSLEDTNEKLEDVLTLTKTFENQLNQDPKPPRQKKEFIFESKLEAFLQVNEIEVERQVCASGKRLDLWIPGQLMIECKSGRVTGDDICQAIDYLSTFKRDVLLVGTGMSSSASRGIEAVNRLSENCKLLFVTQEACFGYLKAVCK